MPEERDLPFGVLAECYYRLESTSGRLDMISLLRDLLGRTPPDVIDKVVYLTLGRVAPEFVDLELGIGEKLALRAIAMASGMAESKVEAKYKELGDIGLVAEWAIQNRSVLAFLKEELTVNRVFNALVKIAKTSGPSSQDIKLKTLAGLLADAESLEARYIMRIVTEKLRLGVRDMTILDALAEAFLGGRQRREILERKYNTYPDIGRIARVLAEKGEAGLDEIKVTLGVPIRPMLAQRLREASEILEKMGSRFLAEMKYDGERMQVHVWPDGRVEIFSRRLENITHPYPDVREGVREAFKGESAILDGEGVAFNPDTGELYPFQELMHRRRKYGVEEMMERYPVVLFLFDLLYLNGEELIDRPLEERRRLLEHVIEESDRIKLAEGWLQEWTTEELEKRLELAVERGTEGLMIKDPASRYQAGVRGWSWVKYKRSYVSKMVEPVDLVAVGAFWGRGKRAGTYGALLLAVYDPETDTFKTVCKMGTGFTDEQLAQLPEIFKEYVIEHRHPSVVSNIEADVWFVPAKVLEVIGDEITLSPVHTCAWGKVKPDAGLAIRFPRFTGRWRDDKSPQDATTEREIVEMYREQLRIISEKR
ncbi:MAG: ATP-dependent DNA ligase [Candidatus Korarchaeota archaeon]|nr:ATP-dependent DNA ligase [Candidatus Korarchaeota archaeon]